MAKTIMIGNEVYHRLKRMKHDRSFTELITSLLDKKDTKRGINLYACAGLLHASDHESEESLNKARKSFARWTKKYV